MPKKKIILQCIGCNNEFTIQHKSKDPVSYCPFCAEEVDGSKLDRPLLKNFDELDEFDEEEYYEDDEVTDDDEDQ